MGAALAELGCVAVVPNYRHYPEVKMTDFWTMLPGRRSWALDACARVRRRSRRVCISWVIPPARIWPRCWRSIGATLRRRVNRRRAIAGVIGLSGPYDFLPLEEADVQDMFGPPERYPKSQPINYVSAACAADAA